jgi:serine/threonine protein kinase
MPEPRVTSHAYPHGALPVGTRLGEFEIRRVLGVGGFGIVYLAFDHLLEREVALKEYMPSTLVDRAETMHVSLLSQENADTFALGLRSFVNEARLLARFDHPSLVKVHRFWEANGTAYMAMALYKGRTVRDVRLEMQTRPDEAWVRKILEPLLGAIERLHSEDVFHRDIAPDNILIEGDGRPVLLDFGAARRVITDRSQALTAILKPSYAPIEQYADVGGMKQGAWTDIYALGATMHFLLLGKPPPPAPGRSIQDTMPPLARQDLVGCSKPFLELIDWMLTPLPNERPQSVATVREALAGRIAPPVKSATTPFDRTAPLPGAGSDLGPAEGATVVLPRGQTAFPSASEEATIIVPRAGSTGYGGQTRTALPPQLPPQLPPEEDEDATVVTPLTSFQTQRPQPAPSPAAPPPRQVVMPSMDTVAPTAQQTAAVRESMGRTAQSPLPPAPGPRKPADAAPATKSGNSWMVPVLGGALVATIAGGMWWFLTRPVVVETTPPAAAVTAEPSVAPPTATLPVASPPVATPSVDVAPTAAAPPVAAPPVAAPPAVVTPTTPPAAAKPPADKPAAVSKPPAPARQADPYPPPRKAEAAPTVTAPPAARQPPVVTPAPATPAPAPVAKPAEPEPARPESPSERCAKELPLVRLICVDLACNRSEFSKHPECLKLRAEQANRRHLEGN